MFLLPFHWFSYFRYCVNSVILSFFLLLKYIYVLVDLNNIILEIKFELIQLILGKFDDR